MRPCKQGRWWVIPGAAIIALLATLLLGPAIATAEEGGRAENADAAMEALREQIRELIEQLRRIDSEAAAEIEELKRRIRQLEAQLERAGGPTEEQPDPADEIEALREAARAEVPEESPEEQEADEQRESMTGHQRTLQDLNPEISFLGDFSYDWSDTDVRDQFVVRGVEIGFQAPLDPYTRFKGFLAAHDELPELQIGGGDEDHGLEVELEEVYIDWVALPGGMSLRVGKFRQRFGTLNRWHQHALLSSDVPFALRNLFGHEGLEAVGIGASWMLPGLWATSNSLTVEITNADNDVAFAGGDFDDPVYLLRHTGFYDLGPDAYLEFGLTGLHGPNDETSDGKTTVGSLDVNYVWEPTGAGRYRGLEFRSELIHSEFEDVMAPGGRERFESTAFYAYLVGKLGRSWRIGLRYDNAELPTSRTELASGTFMEGLRERAYTPFVTFWQSEFVRLRLQYQHASRDFVSPHGPDDDDRVWFQVTFAAGPHKHEAY